jgi:4-amino-4-deoxy-L-arabinose transferase-like glycosyltransferase
MANNQNNNIVGKKRILLICCVMLTSVVTAGWTLSKKALSNHECLVSVTAREMLQSGDWVRPTFNGLPRLQKTPLPYWLVAGLAKITGTVDEFTARFPSVVFAVLSTALILYYTNQWFGLRIASLSALVWTTSLGYVRYSHNARPEMALTFFVSLCLLSFYSAITATTRKKQVVQILVFWVSFGLANLAKGPAPLPLVLLPVLFYLAIFRCWRTVPKMLPILGPIIFLAIVLPWPLAIAHKMNWDLHLWKLEFVDRFLGKYAPGEKPWYYYFPGMFQFIAPWSAFLPFALAAPFYKIWGKKQQPMQMLWLWFVVNLVFLTICGGKRQHYIMPLMPAMAILVGILADDIIFRNEAFDKKQARGFLQWHIVVLTAAILVAPVYIARTKPELLQQTITFCAAMAVIIAGVVVLFIARKPIGACAALFAGYCVLVMLFYTGFVNPFDDNKISRDFSRRIASIVGPVDKVVAFKYVSGRSVHYFGRPIPEISDEELIVRHYEDGDYVLATTDYIEKLLQLGKFNMVYYQEKAECRQKKIAPGALFHKPDQDHKSQAKVSPACGTSG